MKTFLLFLIISAHFIFIAPFASANTFKVAAYTWEPFIDTNRPDGGISIELLRKIMQSQGFDIELVPMPWARSLVMLEKEKIDILPAVWFKQERTESMIFSESYAANRLVFIKAKGSEYEFTGLPSLHNKVVGVIREYAYEESFLNDKNIQFSVADSLKSNVKKVANGRIDLTLDDEIVAKTSISSNLLSDIEFTKNALTEKPLFITCNKNSPKCKTIIDTFNKGLKSMQEDGSLENLMSTLGL